MRAGALLTEIRDLSQSGDWRQVAFDDFEELFRAVRENDEDGRADIALRFANPKRPRSLDEEDEPGSKRSRNADSVSVVLHLDGDSDELPGSTILWNAGLYVSDEDTVAVTAVQECSAPHNDGLRGGWVLTGWRHNGRDLDPPRSWRVMYDYFLDTEGELELIFGPP